MIAGSMQTLSSAGSRAPSIRYAGSVESAPDLGATVSMLKMFTGLFLLSAFFGLSNSPTLTTEDEIRAGHFLFLSFQKANGFAPTDESKAIEAYLKKVGDKVARNASRKLPFEFHLDP